MATLLVLCRFLHFTVVLLMFGLCAYRPWLLGNAPHPALDRQLSRISHWLAWLALLSGIAWLLLISASMAGTELAALQLTTVKQVLSMTFFGEVWRVHLGLSLLLVLALFTPWRQVRLLLSAALLATLAPVGHGAMLDGLNGQLLIFNQIVHLLCVGAWLGGLLVLGLIIRQAAEHTLETVLKRFSGLGYALVAGLLASGLINIRVLTGQWWPTPLFSGFALVLLIKVLLVAGMLGLALLNRAQSRNCQQRLRPLQASVSLEWLLGVAAVAAVALLGTLPPMLNAG